MAFFTSPTALTAVFLFLLHLRSGNTQDRLDFVDSDYLELVLNIEYLEAEFFLNGALGYGLDEVAPGLSGGGPPPIGPQKADLNLFTKGIIEEFAYEEVGHVRAILSEVKGFPRPLLDISSQRFAVIINKAFGQTLDPPFDPFANDINFLLASYAIPYVGVTGLVGATVNLQTSSFKKLVAGLLGVESGQDAVIRTLLYQSAYSKVKPYEFTVSEFTAKISSLRDSMGDEGLKDEGIVGDPQLGAEGRITGNVLASNNQSLSYDRTPAEILRILYWTGMENKTGGFYPNGADGTIAKSYL